MRLYRRFALFTTILFLTLPSLASAAADNVTTFKLKNGMDVVVVVDARAPVVTHMVWYRIGSADDAPGKSGNAHLLEHLMFKGTKTMESGEFSRVVSANGGSENAFTSYDYTGYWQRVAADRLALMMQMEADRMQGLILNAEDVKTERAVVLEERNARTDNNPGARFSEQRRAALYLNHPYGRPIIGWKQEIGALTREDALTFYKKYYAPNNAILIVAGDVDPEEVRTLAEKYYGVLTPSDSITKRKRAQEPVQLSPRRMTFSDPRVAQPYVIRSYLAPERNTGDQKQAAALSLLAEVLGGNGLTSVLGQKLQLEQKVALQATAFYDALSLDPSSFGLVIVPVEGVSLRQGEDALDAAIADFMNTGVDPDQLARIKAQIRASDIYARDNMAGRARRYGEALTSGLTVDDVDAWSDVLQSVTADDIIAAAKMVFDPDYSVTGWLMRSSEEATQ